MADAIKTATGIGSLIPGIGGLLGVGLGLAQNMVGDSELKRKREIEVDQALAQNLGNRERIMAQSPEADRQAKAGTLQMGRAANMGNALNASTGQALKSGIGGDVQAGNIGAIKGSMAASAASAPYDQALAQGFTERASQTAQQNQQLGENTMDRGKLAEMTAYYQGETNSPWKGLMSAALGGANVASSIKTLMGTSADVEKDKQGDPSQSFGVLQNNQNNNQPVQTPGLLQFNGKSGISNIFGWQNQQPQKPFSLMRP